MGTSRQRETRYFTHYWTAGSVELNEPRPCEHAAANAFRARGVDSGDIVYVVNVAKGQLRVLGRFQVDRIVDYDEACDLLPYVPWDADEHLIAVPGTGTILRFDNWISKQVSRSLRFVNASGAEVPLVFTQRNPDLLDQQTLRGIRRLTAVAAASLDEFLTAPSPSAVGPSLARSEIGAGFGCPESNQVVERRAITEVTRHYTSRGWIVRSVEAERVGYDLECRKGRDIHHVEVKGVSGPVPIFIITDGEVRQARSDQSFRLAVITSALHAPTLRIWKGPEFVDEFDTRPIQYVASLRG